MTRERAVAAAVGIALCCVANAAAAQEVLSTPCASDERMCQTAPLHFAHETASPVEFSFDTGWVPPNQPLQVHLWGLVAAHTFVELDGALQTTWPEALTLAAPGDPNGGVLGYHYGVDIGAQAKVSVTVAGQTLSWTGDIPYVPQVDFQVESSQVFDAWGWEPGVSAADSTQKVTLATVDLAGIITSIPGLSGGFALDIALDLDVSYVTDRLAIERATDGEPVQGGHLDGPGQQTLASYPGGPSIAFDVHPEGRVTYDGTLHLYPSLYIDVLGNTQTLQLADIPVDLPPTEDTWIFDSVRVRVPLPDIDATDEAVELGVATVGDSIADVIPIHNAGDMPLYAMMSVDADFGVTGEEQIIMPGDTLDLEVTFSPTETGTQAAPLLIVSNDPDAPSRAITLRGTGVEDDSMIPPPEEPPTGDETLPPVEAGGGCGCEIATPSSPRPWWLVGLALVLRRRRILSA